MNTQEVIEKLRSKAKLTKEERIALSAQRVMERIFDNDFAVTLTAPEGMDLYRYGLTKHQKFGNGYERWIRIEDRDKYRKESYRKKKQLVEKSPTL